MICSGRAKEDALKLLEEYKLSLPVGASNGAIVYVDGKVINSRCLQNDKVYKLAKLLESEGFLINYIRIKEFILRIHGKIKSCKRSKKTSMH